MATSNYVNRLRHALRKERDRLRSVMRVEKKVIKGKRPNGIDIDSLKSGIKENIKLRISLIKKARQAKH